MDDISFFGGGKGDSGGSGGGVTNYNALSNKPVINLSGNPVVLSILSTGVYNVLGTWTVVSGAEVFDSPADDLFCVIRNSDGFKATRISADGIQNMFLPIGGSANDVVYDSGAMVNEVAEQIKDELWGSL